MARVVVFDRFGGPDVLHLVDAVDEVPGEDEVAVRVAAFAVNPLDAMMRSGRSPAPVPLPHARLGIEATGVVEAVGSGSGRVRVGDPVVVAAIPDAAVHGAYAERVVLPAHRVIPRPDALTVREAAAAWVGFSTAYGALVETAGLRPGDQVLVTAATGSVGRAALQVSTMLGCPSIAVTRRTDRIGELRRAGAGDVVATDEEDLVAGVLARTGGAGVDVVLDLVRGPGQQELLRAVRPDGTLVAAGYLDPRPTPPPPIGGARVLDHRGFAALLEPATLARMAAAFADGARSGVVRPALDEVFAFEDVVAAHRRFDAGEHHGCKIVVDVA